MKYSIISNDVVDVDDLIEKIRLYVPKFQNYESDFSHCKNVERFEYNLERSVPELRHRLSNIYSVGKGLAFSVAVNIQECLNIERILILKKAVDKLETELIYLNKWAEKESQEIAKVYEESNYNEWSMNRMLSLTSIMCDEISEILSLIHTIKDSYTYKVQSKELNLAQVRDLEGVKMNTVNNSGNFQNTQISNVNGEDNSVKMTMTNNQDYKKELEKVCQKLIDVIEISVADETEKNNVKNIVNELKKAEHPSKAKETYQSLISSISNHVTVGQAILASQILPTLTNFI